MVRDLVWGTGEHPPGPGQCDSLQRPSCHPTTVQRQQLILGAGDMPSGRCSGGLKPPLRSRDTVLSVSRGRRSEAGDNPPSDNHPGAGKQDACQTPPSRRESRGTPARAGSEMPARAASQESEQSSSSGEKQQSKRSRERRDSKSDASKSQQTKHAGREQPNRAKQASKCMSKAAKAEDDRATEQSDASEAIKVFEMQTSPSQMTEQKGAKKRSERAANAAGGEHVKKRGSLYLFRYLNFLAFRTVIDVS